MNDCDFCRTTPNTDLECPKGREEHFEGFVILDGRPDREGKYFYEWWWWNGYRQRAQVFRSAQHKDDLGFRTALAKWRDRTRLGL